MAARIDPAWAMAMIVRPLLSIFSRSTVAATRARPAGRIGFRSRRTRFERNCSDGIYRGRTFRGRLLLDEKVAAVEVAVIVTQLMKLGRYRGDYANKLLQVGISRRRQ